MQETPMLKQYHSIKSRHRDCILFFRLGDFYEMFYEDAHVASRALDLVLTSRGKAPSPKVPMCGIPYHAAENYIAKLIKSGHKVAICEQIEDPSAAKGIVERDVIRVITSGTYLDEHSSDSRVLLCLSPNSKSVGLAFSDPATGTIQTNQYPFNQNRLVELIANLPVQECVYPQAADEAIRSLFTHPLLKSRHITLSPYDDWCFNPGIAQKALCDHFAVRNLYGFGIEGLPQAASSSGALLEYLKQMNKQPLRHMDKITLYTDDEYVFISPAAFRGLEIDTLVKTMDATLSPLGRRALRFWITHPLKDPEAITKRQRAVQLLLDNPLIAQRIKACLERIPDVEKNISRLSCGLTHAKDLLAVRSTLALIPEMKQTLDPLAAQNNIFALDDIPSLRQHLEATVNEDIPLSHPEGKIIKSGCHQELDTLRDMQENGRLWLKRFQEEEIKRTGINSLRVGFNHVFGYYIEITKANLRLAPEDYIRRQTLVNAERFITPGLKEYEEKILTAQEKILKIESEIVQELRQEILNHSPQLHAFCRAVATIDALYSFAVLAQTPHYIAPEIAADTLLTIKDGRHPVVEKTLNSGFIANDTLLDCDENHLIILTGPNMSGKSTYIRQTALLTILAQAGSFIPAASAHIGIVDKIFTRIGAHDDIAKGQSTFMVEMNETADILNNLTDKSLVILDEIGRGTSTYDGLSLAWALAEHLKDTKVRSLFATHFHELTALADEHEGVKNYNVAVKEWKDEVIFLHKIVPGSADDSYGIYVAKLAGIPAKVIARAQHVLTQLELNNDLKENLVGNSHGCSLPDTHACSLPNIFASSPDPVTAVIRETIEAMDVNAMTPLEALNKVQELKNLIASERKT